MYQTLQEENWSHPASLPLSSPAYPPPLFSVLTSPAFTQESTKRRESNFIFLLPDHLRYKDMGSVNSPFLRASFSFPGLLPQLWAWPFLISAKETASVVWGRAGVGWGLGGVGQKRKLGTSVILSTMEKNSLITDFPSDCLSFHPSTVQVISNTDSEPELTCFLRSRLLCVPFISTPPHCLIWTLPWSHQISCIDFVFFFLPLPHHIFSSTYTHTFLVIP